MSDKQAELTFTHEFQLLQPSPEKAYPVPVAEWNRLIDRICLMGTENRFFESLGWGMFGVSATALLAIITLPKSVSDLPQPVPVVSWAIFAVAGAISAMSFFFARLRGQDRTSMREMVLEDMRSIQQRFEMADEDRVER